MKTKWKPAKFDTGWKMTRECLFNGRPAIEGRPIKWWERIIWFHRILKRRIRTGFWIIIICLFLSGCAKVEGSAKSITVDVRIDPNNMTCYVVSVDANDVMVEITTLGKDVNFGKDGIMSTVSPKNQGILEVFIGFLAGLWL